LKNEEDMEGIHLLRSVKNLYHVLSRLNKRYPEKTMTLIGTSNRLDQLFTDPALISVPILLAREKAQLPLFHCPSSKKFS